jgi:hypothetical protein
MAARKAAWDGRVRQYIDKSVYIAVITAFAISVSCGSGYETVPFRPTAAQQ